MKTKKSGARYSAIVGIGEKLNQLAKQNGQEYLALNRGVPAVTLIDLSKVIPLLDFNSAEMQIYPKNNGLLKLREAINKEYFADKTSNDAIFITHGGMGTIDLVVDTLDVEEILIPKFYWGAYRNIMTMRKVANDIYENYEFLEKNLDQLKNKAVIICDPGNPLGNKYSDEDLIQMIRKLDAAGVVVLFDGPYRKLFIQGNDEFYQELAKLPNTIIMESFSKSLGLSGQRIGFMHTNNKEFAEEFNIRLLYVTNGVNTFAQLLVHALLSTEEGKEAANEFRRITIEGMNKNIVFLQKKGLIAEEFYTDSQPIGIFLVVNKSEEELLANHIGSVGLPFFTSTNKEEAKKFARICIASNPEKVEEFFNKMTE
jgi:aspartate/methionine/tyrosine aminotransferase